MSVVMFRRALKDLRWTALWYALGLFLYGLMIMSFYPSIGKNTELLRQYLQSFPEGMLRAFEYYADDRNEVVGVSIWDSPESRERYRLSDVESRRRQAMAPYVVDEQSGFYVGRELKLPRSG